MDTPAHDPMAMTSRDYVRVLFRQKDVFLVSVVMIVTVIFLGLLMRAPVYEAHVKMIITGEKQVQAPYYRELMGDRNIEASVTQSEIVTSGPVLERVVQALSLHERPGYVPQLVTLVKDVLKLIGKDLPAEAKSKVAFRKAVEKVKRSIKVAPINDTNLFTISVRDVDPDMAAVIANVVSRSYIIFDLEQQLAELTLKYGERHPSVQQLKDNIARMQKNLNGGILANIDAIGPASVKIIEQASVPLKPSGTARSVILLFGCLMSLVVGVVLAFMFEYMDPSFKSPADMERELALPILGSVPRRGRNESALIHVNDKGIARVKFYQILSDQIFLLIKDKNLRSILVTASGGKEGTSTVLANLGVFLSERSGTRVLLVDANFREPVLHKIFDMDNVAGFSDILEGRTGLQGVTREVSKGLHVVSAGETLLNPVILLNSPRTREVLVEAGQKYEVVLVDGPDLIHHRDSVNLAAHADAVIVVISEGHTRRLVIKAALKPLVDRRIDILGIIVNNRTFPIPRFLYERV